MEFLQSVEDFAKQAHGSQQRKFEPGPYYIHLIRVKDLCLQYSSDESIAAGALLHDVLEDTSTTRQQLLDFLEPIAGAQKAKQVLQLVVELTDIYTKDNYPHFNRRKRKSMEAERLSKTSAEAQTIKYADIIDNSLTIANAEGDFASLYLAEALTLLKAMQKGNPDLRSKAMETVEKCRNVLRDGY